MRHNQAVEASLPSGDRRAPGSSVTQYQSTVRRSSARGVRGPAREIHRWGVGWGGAEREKPDTGRSGRGGAGRGEGRAPGAALGRHTRTPGMPPRAGGVHAAMLAVHNRSLTSLAARRVAPRAAGPKR